ncbi:tetratricopeptide repeat protein [bacterium]|nr:tetratricopeptide repeat protein [bacterium]
MSVILAGVLIALPLLFGFALWVKRELIDITDSQFLFIEIVCFVSFGLEMFFFMKGKFLIGILFIFLPPVIWFLMEIITRITENQLTKMEEEKEKEELLETIQKNPVNVNAYIKLGDIYFKKEDYEKALFYYRKAHSIQDLPWILHRIKVTEKEDRIKKGLIWVCPDCSFENPSETKKCKNCGYTKEIKDELEKHKDFILKGILWIIFGPIPVMLGFFLFWLIIFLSIKIGKKTNIILGWVSFGILTFLLYLIIVNLINHFSRRRYDTEVYKGEDEGNME